MNDKMVTDIILIYQDSESPEDVRKHAERMADISKMIVTVDHRGVRSNVFPKR